MLKVAPVTVRVTNSYSRGPDDQNPAAHFRMDEDIFVTGFMIPQENWRGRAESVS
jgi:hypothetical protein